jgi:hypothetical protein
MPAGELRVGSGPAGAAAMVLGIVGLTGQVLTLGTGGWFLLFSLAAWALGQREVQKLAELGVPLRNLGQARAGHVLGAIGVMVSVAMAALGVFLIGLLVATGVRGTPRGMLITDF